MSSSALSRRIQKLEDIFNVQLFDHSTRSVRLTRAGAQLLERVQEVLSQTEELLLAFKGKPHRRGATLTIAAVPSVTRSLLPEIIRLMRHDNPSIFIRVIDTTTAQVLESVRSGVADIGLNYLGENDGDLVSYPLMHDEFVLAVPSSSEFASRMTMSCAEIAEIPTVTVWKGAGIRVMLDTELAKTGLSLRSLCEVRHVSTAFDFVEAGVGLAVVPSLVFPNKSAVTSIKLVAPVIFRTMSVIGFPDALTRALPSKFTEMLKVYRDEVAFRNT